VYALKVVTYTHGTLDKRELEVISAVCMADSDFIVRVYNWWYEVDPMFDKYCILMELCDTNLADVLRLKYFDQEGYFTEREIWEITCNIMEGIQKCHDLNFTHRDLKPQNSLFSSTRKFLTFLVLYSSKTKTWKLSDFGIALKLPASVPVVASGLPSPPLTPTGEYTALPPPGSNISLTKRGSPGYVAPELLYSGICSRKGDIWSIGCILYELACGKMAFPFTGNGFALSPEDPLRKYYCGEGDKYLPEVLRTDNPLLMRCVGNNYFGGPVSGRYRINQVISWCLERDASDRPKIGRLVNHVKSIVWQQE